jgi:hypothetical protein
MELGNEETGVHLPLPVCDGNVMACVDVSGFAVLGSSKAWQPSDGSLAFRGDAKNESRRKMQ